MEGPGYICMGKLLIKTFNGICWGNTWYICFKKWIQITKEWIFVKSSVQIFDYI